MKKLILVLVMSFLSNIIYANPPAIDLEDLSFSASNKASVQRGAKFFAANCMSCHTLKYLRYNKLAQDNGILYSKMPINTKWPQDAIPPDLSLEADIHPPAWIYTYLHSFYVDTTSKTGYNNLLVTNSKMPDILAPYQGQQVLATDLKQSTTLTHEFEWYDVLTLQSQGSMTPADFDATVKDVVNFLMYAAEPYHMQQVKIGKWVIVYLLILFVFVYLLKREYWKDIH